MRNTCSVTIFHHTLFSVYQHDIMSAVLRDIRVESDFEYLSYQKMDFSRMDDFMPVLKMGDFPVKHIINLKNNRFASGYLLRYVDLPIGYFFVMNRGGKEDLYKVKNADCYLFNVCIFNDYRGKGFSKYIFCVLKDILPNDSLLKLACRSNNTVAHRLYDSVGFRIERKRKFFRIAGRNFPYYSV